LHADKGRITDLQIPLGYQQVDAPDTLPTSDPKHDQMVLDPGSKLVMHEDLSLVLTPKIMPDSKFSDPLGSLFWIARQIQARIAALHHSQGKLQPILQGAASRAFCCLML
jgi:hypothetical protein